MREEYCVGYTPGAWDPRFIHSIIDIPLYFRRVVMDPQSAKITTTTTWTGEQLFCKINKLSL